MHGSLPLEGGAASPAPEYKPLAPVQCVAFADTRERLRNMRYSLSARAGVKRIQELPVSTVPRLSIVGGGPSLNETYKDIQGPVMVCGSAHDHAVKLGLKPDYALECDPSLRQVQQYRENPEGCIYLVASRCHRTMFQHLQGRHVRLWHMWEQDLGKPPYKGEPAFLCGATCVLAAIPVGLTMGFREFDFYGVDSSFETFENHHAYPQDEFAQVMTVKVGHPETGADFTTTATWIGQAQQYQDMVKNWGHLFKGRFHGKGMLAEMERQAGR
jgi:hypothetical protein